ncbi:telomeric repeat-binding factor 1 isoform X2 [Pezoporus flaviventris]|uniref:telomeric repeat-binding factor 1 isoform X2 n=1 Tax=Pezoporus flaviventris TaxID=889875 RepID=UPI002AAF28F3|nr:telomeric repeat-binding factor 1 isoform X2 [Pezoporus flaviventris]
MAVAGESPVLSAEVKAVAAGWMLEFSCCCLCRHFGDGCSAEFQRWSDVAHALINGLSKIPTHQEKTVYLCQLLIRIAKGKKLECYFENSKRISPLESALSFWSLLEREEVELEKLHKDIRQLIQIQPLRMKLATVIKSKDPYVPLLQTFSYNVLISKIKSYIELFMKENETNFLLQAAIKEVESQGPGAITSQSKTVNADKNIKENFETKQRLTKEQHSTTDQSPGDVRDPAVRPHSGGRLKKRTVLQSLNGLQNVEKHGHALVSVRKRQRWTYKEDLQLKLGVKEFGVGNWAKILVHGDFNNRTSVMLKDRWRTLCKIHQG